MCALDVINSETKKKALKVLSSSDIGSTINLYVIFIVYNFLTQQRPSFGNQYILDILNFVMAMRDITLRSLLSKSIHLSRDFQPFQFQEKCCANGFWLDSENQSTRSIAKVSSGCLHYLQAAILEDQGGPPTWQLDTKLYNLEPTLPASWGVLPYMDCIGMFRCIEQGF